MGTVTYLGAVAPTLPPQGSSQGVTAYLGSLQSPASRRAMGSALNQVARILTGDSEADALGVPWQALRG